MTKISRDALTYILPSNMARFLQWVPLRKSVRAQSLILYMTHALLRILPLLCPCTDFFIKYLFYCLLFTFLFPLVFCYATVKYFVYSTSVESYQSRLYNYKVQHGWTCVTVTSNVWTTSSPICCSNSTALSPKISPPNMTWFGSELLQNVVIIITVIVNLLDWVSKTPMQSFKYNKNKRNWDDKPVLSLL